MTTDAAVNLTDAETTLLARRLCVARLLAEDFPEWEDVPLLTERGHQRLHDAVKLYARELAIDLRRREQETGIDARYLLERVTA